MNVQKVKIAEIKVQREQRQRQKLEDIKGLAASIKSFGLINPVTVSATGKGFVLVAGERRIEAAKLLKWTEIPALILEEMDDEQKKILELEENIRREDLPWQDRVKAVSEIEKMLRARGLTVEEIAEYLGYNRSHLSKMLRVQKAIDSGDEVVGKAPSVATASNIVKRKADRKVADQLDSIINPVAGGIKPKPPKEVEGRKAQIICDNFHEWAKNYRGQRFNLVHCDFPFGIGHNKSKQGAAELHGSYEDEEETFWDLCRTFCAFRNNFAAASCHVMFWFSMNFYTDIFDFFKEYLPQLRWNPFPLIWHKSDNTGIIPDAKRGPRRVYETALLGSIGDRSIVRPVSNLYAQAANKMAAAHLSEKPFAVVRHFLRMLVDDSTRLLDPTCGSGSAIQAGKILKAEYSLGIELDIEVASSAANQLDEKVAVYQAMEKVRQ